MQYVGLALPVEVDVAADRGGERCGSRRWRRGRDPDSPVPRCDATWGGETIDASRRVSRWIDAVDGVGNLVCHPHRTGAERDAADPGVQRDSGLLQPGDPQDVPVLDVRHPHGAASDGKRSEKCLFDHDTVPDGVGSRIDLGDAVLLLDDPHIALADGDVLRLDATNARDDLVRARVDARHGEIRVDHPDCLG